MPKLVEKPVPDMVTGLETTVLVDAGDDPPASTLAPPTVRAITVLKERPGIDWARAVCVQFPNGTKEWIDYHSENSRKFEDFEPLHGDVYQADFIEGILDKEPEDGVGKSARYQGRLSSMEPIREGVNEKVRRSDLNEEVRDAYQTLIKEIDGPQHSSTEE